MREGREAESEKPETTRGKERTQGGRGKHCDDVFQDLLRRHLNLPTVRNLEAVKKIVYPLASEANHGCIGGREFYADAVRSCKYR